MLLRDSFDALPNIEGVIVDIRVKRCSMYTAHASRLPSAETIIAVPFTLMVVAYRIYSSIEQDQRPKNYPLYP